LTWFARENSRIWSSVASSADGCKLVAVVSPGQIFTSGAPNASAGTSLGADGYLQGGQGTAIELQHVGAGSFLPLSHEGVIYAY
jgi:hypothetical protein